MLKRLELSSGSLFNKGTLPQRSRLPTRFEELGLGHVPHFSNNPTHTKLEVRQC